MVLFAADRSGRLLLGLGPFDVTTGVLVDALGRKRSKLDVRFLSNIDGAAFDEAVAPLDPAGKFNRCKSFLRALEYAARGIPVVASACEAYSGFVEHGVTGFLVRYDHEWGRYLRDLVNDEGMRAEMGAAAKKLAATWTIQQRYTAWEQCDREVMDRVPVP